MDGIECCYTQAVIHSKLLDLICMVTGLPSQSEGNPPSKGSFEDVCSRSIYRHPLHHARDPRVLGRLPARDPTRYGNFPLSGKCSGIAPSSNGRPEPIGESTRVSSSPPQVWEEGRRAVINALSTLTHHGIIFVPLGYKTSYALQAESPRRQPLGRRDFCCEWNAMPIVLESKPK